MENQFVKISTPLDDVFILERFCHSDERGIFTKTFNLKMFKELEVGEALEIKESLCSTSKKGVLRECTINSTPMVLRKIVSVWRVEYLMLLWHSGKFNAQTEEKYFQSNFLRIMLRVYAWRICAWFPSFKRRSSSVYHQTSHFDAASDKGINFNSFDFNGQLQANS